MLLIRLTPEETCIGKVDRRSLSNYDKDNYSIEEVAEVIRSQKIDISQITEITSDNCLFGLPDRKVVRFNLEEIKALL